MRQTVNGWGVAVRTGESAKSEDYESVREGWEVGVRWNGSECESLKGAEVSNVE